MLRHTSALLGLLALCSSALSTSAVSSSAPKLLTSLALGSSGSPLLSLRGGNAEVPVAPKTPEAVPADPKKVFLANLPKTCEDDELRTFCEAVGEVAAVDVKRYQSTGTCKGFALVTYKDAELATKALEVLSGSDFKGRSVLTKPDAGFDPAVYEERRVKREEAKAKAAAEGREPRYRPKIGSVRYWPKCPRECRVFVGNIKYGTRWQDVRDHMAQAGKVDFGKIIKTAKEREDGSVQYVSRGYAIVQYATVEDAQNAIQTLNESAINGRTIYVKADESYNRNRAKEQTEGEAVNAGEELNPKP